MSLFSSRRKAGRRISTFEDDDAGSAERDGEGPVVVRPPPSRSGSIRSKKRASSSSRLSFGGTNAGDDDVDIGDEPTPSAGVSTPKRKSGPSLTQRVLETNAFRKSLSSRLPTRTLDSHEDNDDRPRYSKEYLEELQSSTPNTPQNLSSLRIHDGPSGNGATNNSDDMELDPSELDGAMVVDSSELGSIASQLARPPILSAQVLTDTEIQERKDRRARLAKEQNAIMALGSDDDDEVGYISLVSDSKKKKKQESRLVREDEDLGEGYDEFVEDEGLSLGRKAEREARRKRKKEMAALINEAQGKGNEDGNHDSTNGGKGNDDSDDERRAAYDAAQTRAGMDGLKRPGEDLDGGTSGSIGPAVVPKMKPLPELSTCLAGMQGTLYTLQTEVAERRRRLAEAEKEREEILAREKEVQGVLDTAGQKYQAILGASASKADLAAKIAGNSTQSPLRPLPPGLAGAIAVERGLESLGTTPTRQVNMDDVF